MTLPFTQGHNCISTLTNVKRVPKQPYLGQYASYGIQTWHGSRLMHGICAHARSDDVDLDARSQWVDKRKQSTLNYLDNYATNKH